MKNKRYYLVFLAAYAALLYGSTQAADLVAMHADGAQETITLSVPSAQGHKVFTVENPDRLVVDVPSVGKHPARRCRTITMAAQLNPSASASSIRRLRVSCST